MWRKRAAFDVHATPENFVPIGVRMAPAEIADTSYATTLKSTCRKLSQRLFAILLGEKYSNLHHPMIIRKFPYVN